MRVLTFLIFLIFLFSIVYSPKATFYIQECTDSDGDCNYENLIYRDYIYETVDLLTYPYGYLEVENFNISIPSGNSIDEAYIYAVWHTDVGFGASNINIEYFDGTSWNVCYSSGEQENDVETICNVSHLSTEQILNLKVRIRGEDLDGFPNSYLYVDTIQLLVNYSAPPLWKNMRTSNPENKVYYKESINLSVEVFDDLGLAYAILSTNESGEWVNYTDGTYGSPIYLNKDNEWITINFTWKNESIKSGTIAWKVYIFDKTGKVNVTEVQIFYVRYRLFPNSCIDSDGDCNYENLIYRDYIYETVDLLTYPYGYLEVQDWIKDISEKIKINSAYLHLIWHTDFGFGASNINIEYFDGTSWNICYSYDEQENDVETICNVSHLSTEQILNLKVRIRGEDLDGFPNSYLYVDTIFIEIDYSVVKAYLEVYLVSPSSKFINFVFQNNTFFINATVICRNDYCGYVYGVVRYNSTSENPDTPIPEYESLPFFIQGDSQSIKSCGEMDKDYTCSLSWIVNATGPINSYWKVGVMFYSSLPEISANHTENATIKIVYGCAIDLILSFSEVNFGSLYPSTFQNLAVGNYSLLVNPSTTCNVNIYVKSTDLYNHTYNSTISSQNILISSINDYNQAIRLSSNFVKLFERVPPNTEIPLYFWLDVPAVYAGIYLGNITFKASEE